MRASDYRLFSVVTKFYLTNTCFALLPNVYSFMVPGNLPSQLEILSTGQTYYGTKFYIPDRLYSSWRCGLLRAMPRNALCSHSGGITQTSNSVIIAQPEGSDLAEPALLFAQSLIHVSFAT